MRLVNTSNGGVVEVSDELGERLKLSGSWQEPGKTTKRRTRKTTPKKETEGE